MLIGQIKDNRPVIFIAVGSGLGTVQNVLVLIDSGFTAELKISEELAEQLGIKTEYIETVSLAVGKATIPAGFAHVSLEGQTEKVSVLIGGRPSIGIGLLRKFGYSLHMDCVNDQIRLQRYTEDPVDFEG